MIPTMPPPGSTPSDPQSFPVQRATAILQATTAKTADTPRPRFFSPQRNATNVYQAKTRLLITSLALPERSPEMLSVFDYVSSLPGFIASAAVARAAAAAPVDRSRNEPQLRLPLRRRQQSVNKKMATTQKVAEKPKEPKKFEDEAADFRYGLFS